MFIQPNASSARISALLLAGMAVLAVGAQPVLAASDDSVGYLTILQLQSEKKKERRAAQKALIASRDKSLIPGLIDSLFFTPRELRDETVQTLEALAEIELGANYKSWVEWVGMHPEIDPRDGYVEFKSRLLTRIDSLYGSIFYFKVPMKIRFEEVVWGGVRVGGIPALVNPATLAVEEAKYLRDDELVFGAAVEGEYRAYPLRIMDWHELINDTIAGRPVALSYCTLCRSGILYDTRKPGGQKPGGQEPGDEHFVFGTSGVLYRSNKLMIDEETLSLWSNLTGEPVVGKLTSEPIRLEVLAMTLTTWQEWRTLHPETTVLDLAALQSQYAFLYEPGAAEESRKGVAFPVWQKDSRLGRNDEVYALIVDGKPKAYSVDGVIEAGVVNDAVGTTAIVLVADPASGSIRAFSRGEHTLQRNPQGELVDDQGNVWAVNEEALTSRDGHGDAQGEGNGDVNGQAQRLERLPGHVAYWFGWYGFYPSTELWIGAMARADRR